MSPSSNCTDAQTLKPMAVTLVLQFVTGFCMQLDFSVSSPLRILHTEFKS